MQRTIRVNLYLFGEVRYIYLAGGVRDGCEEVGHKGLNLGVPDDAPDLPKGLLGR